MTGHKSPTTFSLRAAITLLNERESAMNTITLFKTVRGWMARFSEAEIKELFGTDTLPTPFTAAASPAVVMAEVRRLNPRCVVILSA